MSKCRVGHRVLCTRFVNPTYGNQTVGRVLNIDGLGSKPDIVLSEDEVMSGFLRDSLRESHENPTYGKHRSLLVGRVSNIDRLSSKPDILSI